jgi:hypothetical protein
MEIDIHKHFSFPKLDQNLTQIRLEPCGELLTLLNALKLSYSGFRLIYRSIASAANSNQTDNIVSKPRAYI